MRIAFIIEFPLRGLYCLWMDKAPAASRFAGKVVTMAILFLLLAALTLTQGVSTSVSANRHEHKLDDAGQRQSLDWHVPQQRIAYVNNGSPLLTWQYRHNCMKLCSNFNCRYFVQRIPAAYVAYHQKRDFSPGFTFFSPRFRWSGDWRTSWWVPGSLKQYAG